MLVCLFVCLFVYGIVPLFIYLCECTTTYLALLWCELAVCGGGGVEDEGARVPDVGKVAEELAALHRTRARAVAV